MKFSKFIKVLTYSTRSHVFLLPFLSFHVAPTRLLSLCYFGRLSLLFEGNKIFLHDDDENDSSIRRACSLSDLSMGKGKFYSSIHSHNSRCNKMCKTKIWH